MPIRHRRRLWGWSHPGDAQGPVGSGGPLEHSRLPPPMSGGSAEGCGRGTDDICCLFARKSQIAVSYPEPVRGPRVSHAPGLWSGRCHLLPWSDPRWREPPPPGWGWVWGRGREVLGTAALQSPSPSGASGCSRGAAGITPPAPRVASSPRRDIAVPSHGPCGTHATAPQTHPQLPAPRQPPPPAPLKLCPKLRQRQRVPSLSPVPAVPRQPGATRT